MAQIHKDVKAVARAAHIASVLLNALGEIDSDTVEEVAAMEEGKGDAMCVVGALHGITSAFTTRANGAANAGIRQIADQIMIASMAKPIVEERRAVCGDCGVWSHGHPRQLVNLTRHVTSLPAVGACPTTPLTHHGR
jgi:hypothetical protein